MPQRTEEGGFIYTKEILRSITEKAVFRLWWHSQYQDEVDEKIMIHDHDQRKTVD